MLNIWALVPKFRVNPTRSPGGFASDLTSPLVTANWEAESGGKWTVPVGDWSIRMQLQFMFPRMG